jgi:hypothetical protein
MSLRRRAVGRNQQTYGNKSVRLLSFTGGRGMLYEIGNVWRVRILSIRIGDDLLRTVRKQSDLECRCPRHL